MPDVDTALAEPTFDTVAELEAGAQEPATAQAPAAPPPAKGKDKKGKDKKGKDKKGKDKKGKKEKAPVVLGDGPSIAGHPRATRSVEHAKAWGALVGFVLGGYLSLPTHTLANAGLRALIAGAILYVAAWAGAVFVWRRLVVVEIKAREAAVMEAAQTALANRQAIAETAGRAGQTASR